MKWITLSYFNISQYRNESTERYISTELCIPYREGFKEEKKGGKFYTFGVFDYVEYKAGC